jgi:YYY domain-containing protein
LEAILIFERAAPDKERDHVNEVFAVFLWWLIIEILGLIALPLTVRLFRHLPDRGYALAKPLGLLSVSYVLWVGATFGLLHNSVGGVVFSILVVGAFSWWFYARGEKDGNLLALLKERNWAIVASEVLFVLAFGLWALYRAYNPEIAGTEKPMDFGFLNAILRSETFPPHDPWLSGFAISYYYFGYLMMAVLTKLSGVPSNITFNLGIALLFALTMTGAFSLVYNLIKRSKASEEAEGDPSVPSASLGSIFHGVLGAVLVAVVGNLEGFLEILHAKGIGSAGFWRWLDLKDLGEAPTTNTWMPTRYLWWWRASRIIHDRDLLGKDMEVIDEFPFFSFLLGDMHPHVLALPFVLLALALAFNWLLSRRKLTWPELGLTAFCLGALGFLNTWDFPIYLFIAVAAYAAQRYGHHRAFNTEWLKDVGYTAVLLAVLGFAFYLPFYIGFRSQAGGLLPTLFNITRLNQYLVIFGLFVFALVGFLIARVTELLSQSPPALFLDWRRFFLWTYIVLPLAISVAVALAVSVAILPVVVTEGGRAFLQGVLDSEPVRQVIGQQTLDSLLRKSLELRFSNPWSFLFPVLLIALVIVLILYESRITNHESRISEDALTPAAASFSPSILFVLLMAFTALLLTFSVEFVYLRDLFSTRMNTIFKFYFQAWVLLAVSSAFCVYYLTGRGKVNWARSLWLAGFGALFLAGMVYPLLAGYTKADGFRGKPTLDGTAYMANHNADDHAAIQWLNENVKGAPVILEATGGSYSYYARISSQTGLPTLLGWDWHEVQWRGTGEEGNKRKPDIETIYTTRDGQQALGLLDKWKVDYVIVGATERNYVEQLCSDPDRHCRPAEALSKFDYIMDVVYQQGTVTIYKRR